jgi:hypothetical protein
VGSFFSRDPTYSETNATDACSNGAESSKSLSLKSALIPLRANSAILLITGLYVLAGYLVQQAYDLDGFIKLRLHYGVIDVFAVFASILFFAAHLIIRAPYLRHGVTGLKTMLRQIREVYLTAERVLGFLFLYISLAPFLSVFLSFKTGIPRIHPFAWDETFMQWDYHLHFGHHPWTLLQPLFGRPRITRAIDVLYIWWLPLLLIFIFWMAWTRRRVLRSRFFFALGCVWAVLGSFVATVFSSGGPCYYSYLVRPENPFIPLMSYLHSIDATRDLAALRIQNRLWETYTGATHFDFAGISAMPSIHLAGAMLFALTGYQVSRWLGWVLFGYCAIIQIGSVHLGWHYAIDGYAGMVFTWLIWRLGCWIYQNPECGAFESSGRN